MDFTYSIALRPDFSIWLNGEELESSKEGKGLLKKWTLGKDLSDFPRPAQGGITVLEDKSQPDEGEHRFGLDVFNLGRVTGYAEAYEDLLPGDKSDEIDRSHGFLSMCMGGSLMLMMVILGYVRTS